MQKILLMSCVVLSLASCKAQETLPKTANTPTRIQLAHQGKTSYVIALASDAIPAEKKAAQQLQKNLQTVTGVLLPLKNEAEVGVAAPQILVGAGRRAKSLLPKQNWQSLRHDGIVIKTVGNKLILAGGRPRGSLYAVYQFLEDEVGCRWWTETESYLPRKTSLNIKPQNVTYVSPFDYREHFTKSVRQNPEFATIMRENGHYMTQGKEWGGHYTILGYCHTFNELLPLKKYFKEHPEWYPDPSNGYLPCTSSSPVPHDEATQLCFSNPELVEELSKNALAWIAENPEAGYISISQNDARNSFCRCPDCLKLEQAEGSPSGPLINFVNQVAARIGEKHPDFLVETLAYLNTEVPPKTIHPAKNVIVRFAPLDADFSRPLNSESNKGVRDNLLGWSQLSTNLFVWNYVTNFAYPLSHHPNWDSLATDLRFFAEHKVKGVFEQGDTYSKHVGDFLQLRAWLIGKLMWNPNLDQEKLIDEFMRGYYGAAGPSLRQYLKVVETSFLKENRRLAQDNADFSYLSLDVLNEGTRLFDAAEAAVKHDKQKLFRVQRERLVLDLAWANRYRKLKLEAEATGKEFLGSADPQKFLADFPEKANGFGDESYTKAGDFPNMFAPAAQLPEFARKLPYEDVFDFQQNGFWLYLHQPRELVSIISDDAASDGKAVKLTGNTGEWAAQAQQSFFLDGTARSKWRVYAYVRVPVKAGASVEGKGVSIGIYDKETKKSALELQVPLKQIAGEQYQRVDLGVHNLSSQTFVYFVSSDSPNVENVYIDRVFFVREK